MITYEFANSPIFRSNKNYIEKIVDQLKSYIPRVDGYCSSFGFNIEIHFSKDNYSYLLKLHKHQSTQNGVVVPVDAFDFLKIELVISDLPATQHFHVGKSAVRRLMMSNQLTEIFPAPYFATFSDERFAQSIYRFVQENNIEEIALSKGILTCMKFGKMDVATFLIQATSIVELCNTPISEMQ